ncbi:DUF2169 domain-containing protein [Myxococcus stipitatus]|uniref:DUF2169 family type VI secretion system accessory protein n=1 Tax=Myxococcus stipitatus TaxID=83455 RepID=UPI0031455EFC
MWALRNQTAYAVERNWTRDKSGAHHWLVAVKAAFLVAPDGRLSLAEEQPPPILTPEYRGEPGSSSLRYDSDLLAFKPVTDVLVEASAHAPGGKPTPSVPVALRFAQVRKSLVVHGTRVFMNGFAGVVPSKPVPFTERPIVYEWAYGGHDQPGRDAREHRMDPRNPVGKGIAVKPARLLGQPAHAIEYAEGHFEKMGPAGFGPIAAGWSPRRELGGTFDTNWERKQKPLLPTDYDERFALSAPHDQRPDQHLRGGERMELVNLTPEGVLRFDLPKLYFVMTTWFGREAREHRAKLATVFIDTVRMRLELVWQSTLRVPPRDVDHLDQTDIEEKPFLS